MVELTRDDWTRLTTLIHGYGSVGALERALGTVRTAEPGHSGSVDLAEMVRVEVAHQLGNACRTPEPQTLQRKLQVAPSESASRDVVWIWPLVWRAGVVAWVALGLIAAGGVSPLLSIVAGIVAVVGVQLGLRHDGGMGLAWRAVATGCVIAWAATSGWPTQVSAPILMSVAAICLADPVRSLIEGRDLL
jgi:hypothetical protein